MTGDVIDLETPFESSVLKMLTITLCKLSKDDAPRVMG